MLVNVALGRKGVSVAVPSIYLLTILTSDWQDMANKEKTIRQEIISTKRLDIISFIHR